MSKEAKALMGALEEANFALPNEFGGFECAEAQNIDDLIGNLAKRGYVIVSGPNKPNIDNKSMSKEMQALQAALDRCEADLTADPIDAVGLARVLAESGYVVVLDPEQAEKAE